ncbi:MAG: heme-binding protein [Candidatus Thiodiazotropha sp.]
MINPRTSLFALLLILGLPLIAGDIVSHKAISPDLALEMVKHALEACRKRGYQVTAVVVAGDGAEVALMRDVHASRFTIQIAREKANAVILSGIASGEFRDNRRDIQQQMNHVNGVLLLQGGLPISAGGYQLGAIGVSGAPGGERDELCAKDAIDKVQDRLEFAD